MHCRIQTPASTKKRNPKATFPFFYLLLFYRILKKLSTLKKPFFYSIFKSAFKAYFRQKSTFVTTRMPPIFSKRFKTHAKPRHFTPFSGHVRFFLNHSVSLKIVLLLEHCTVSSPPLDATIILPFMEVNPSSVSATIVVT